MKQEGTDPPASPPAGAGGLTLDALAGVGLGSLLGMMIGFSSSPVVATFVGAVAAALVSILGLSGKTQAMSRHGSARLAGFALACTLITPVALWMRTHDTLGLSLDHRLERARTAWTGAGFAPKDVQRLAVYQELGNIPAGVMGMPLTAGPPESKAAPANEPHAAAGALFADEQVSEEACVELRHDFGNSRVALTTFKNQGGPWARLAARAEQEWARDGSPVDDRARVQILKLVRDLACGVFG